MADKLMYIPPIMIQKITPFVDYNKLLKSMETQLNEPAIKIK